MSSIKDFFFWQPTTIICVIALTNKQITNKRSRGGEAKRERCRTGTGMELIWVTEQRGIKTRGEPTSLCRSRPPTSSVVILCGCFSDSLQVLKSAVRVKGGRPSLSLHLLFATADPQARLLATERHTNRTLYRTVQPTTSKLDKTKYKWLLKSVHWSANTLARGTDPCR